MAVAVDRAAAFTCFAETENRFCGRAAGQDTESRAEAVFSEAVHWRRWCPGGAQDATPPAARLSFSQGCLADLLHSRPAPAFPTTDSHH